MLLASSDTRRTLNYASILVYKLRQERTGFNVRRVYSTAINFPCISTFGQCRSTHHNYFQFFSYVLDLLKLILTEWTVFIQCPHKKVSNDIASLQTKRVIFVFLSKKILNGVMKSEWLKEFCSNFQTIDFPLYWFIIKVLYYPIYTAFSSYLEKKRSLIQF